MSNGWLVRMVSLDSDLLSPSSGCAFTPWPAAPRKELLANLCALAPVIAALGGPEALAETFRAIQDVGRWWP